MALPEMNALLMASIVIGLIGALVGTLGYAATVGRRQLRHVAAVAERLALATAPPDLVDMARISDPMLRSSLTRLAERIGQAWTLATVDLLTEALNRPALLARLEEELERADRYQRPCSIVLVDLDHFKRINDAHGHAAGDTVLRAVADVLRTNIRSTDALGRYGGEEFMLVLPETDADEAATTADKLRRLVGSREIRLEGGHVARVTLSAGVAGGLLRHQALDALVRDADAALYSAKALGRDQVYVFRELEEDNIVRRVAIGPKARAEALDVGRTAMNAATTALIDALVNRFGWAGKPSTMIAEISVNIGRAMNLPVSEVERIRNASLLHDLGKLAIPEEILANPGELSDPEWRVVAEHPKIGEIVLEEAGALRDAATIVLHHHEWYDGRGYPHGLAGQEIPLGARIVAIADAYEAMVSGRPYRAAVDHAGALAELRRHAGMQFDPEIVRMFVKLFGEGVPWAAGPEAEAVAEAEGRAADSRSHAEIHDALHARRRIAVPTVPTAPPAASAAAISVSSAASSALSAASSASPTPDNVDRRVATGPSPMDRRTATTLGDRRVATSPGRRRTDRQQPGTAAEAELAARKPAVPTPEQRIVEAAARHRPTRVRMADGGSNGAGTATSRVAGSTSPKAVEPAPVDGPTWVRRLATEIPVLPTLPGDGRQRRRDSIGRPQLDDEHAAAGREAVRRSARRTATG